MQLIDPDCNPDCDHCILAQTLGELGPSGLENMTLKDTNMQQVQLSVWRSTRPINRVTI